MKFDLHTHSTASDGELSPTDLVERASLKGVTHLAITDHDTTAAYAELGSQAAVTLIPGIELSTRWRKIGVHIVGLGLDLGNNVLNEGIAQQQRARRERAENIATRLAKAGFPDTLSAATELAGRSTVGRPHFARHLAAAGHVRSVEEAFRKYLGDGKLGDVRQHWAPLTDVIEWIRSAGGVAVLAHPAHYRLTRTKLCELLDDFTAAGGQAMEVISGKQDASLTRKLAALADDFALYASTGSDFHRPAARWAELGSCPALPDTCRPVWDLWG